MLMLYRTVVLHRALDKALGNKHVCLLVHYIWSYLNTASYVFVFELDTARIV